MFKALVVGDGRAGRARVKAIEAVDEIKLYDHVSFHKGLTLKDLDVLLEDPELDMVFVCGVNATHYQIGKMALQKKKHTSIEFPIANTSTQTKHLYQIAKNNDVSLHSAPIALLTAQHEHLLQQSLDLYDSKVSLAFQGGFYSWIETEALQGHLGQLAVGRLHTLWSLFGPLRIQEVETDITRDGYEFRVVFSGVRNNTVELIERRERDLQRQYHWTGLSVNIGERRPLFQLDTKLWIRAIQEGTELYVLPKTQIQVMDQAERISSHVCTDGL